MRALRAYYLKRAAVVGPRLSFLSARRKAPPLSGGALARKGADVYSFVQKLINFCTKFVHVSPIWRRYQKNFDKILSKTRDVAAAFVIF